MQKTAPRTLGAIALVTGVVSLCLLILPYIMFPQWYISKADAIADYTAPATIEGWIFMVAGLALLGVAIVCTKMRKIE